MVVAAAAVYPASEVATIMLECSLNSSQALQLAMTAASYDEVP